LETALNLSTVINKLNQIEAMVKAHGKRLDQVENQKINRDFSREDRQLSKDDYSRWLKRFSIADVIQSLILLILTWTLLYQARSYDQAGQSEKNQARAWVGTGVYNSWVHVPESTTDLAKWHISIKNYGQSPALEVNFHTRFLTLGRDARYDIGKQRQFLREQVSGLTPIPPFDGTTIFPGEDIPNEGFARKPFTKDELEGFHSGRLWVIIAGKVFYKDIFGEAHVTQFCRIAYPPTAESPEGGMGACLVADKAD
jgi:hypothetical protein